MARLVTEKSSSILPILVVALGVAAFATMDAVMKQLVLALGTYNAIFWRISTAACIAALLFLIHRPAWPNRQVQRLHWLRGTVGATSGLCFFWGLARVPLAEAIALSFIAPLIALYLASLWLGEQIQPKAVIASLLGFAGVLVIALSRMHGQFETTALYGITAILVSAILYAVNLILQRKQSLVAGPVEVGFFQAMTASCLFGLVAPWLVNIPPLLWWPHILLSAVLTLAAFMLFAWAYARAEAQILAPIEYSAFIWAALLGALLFGEALQLATLAGAILIIGGCLIALIKTKPGNS
jgi:S-adenosylmethionine uptake transporter